MIKRNAGFTLVEILISMVMFVFVIIAASNIFTTMLQQFKQQSKIVETNVEGMIGLEILLRDIEHAGFGLPWVIPAGITYTEALGSPASTFNDASNPPRVIVSGNSMTFTSPNDIFNGSDYLVVKAVNVARNGASEKSTNLRMAPFTSPFNPRTWTPASENLDSTDRVIVISPKGDVSTRRILIVNGTVFYTTYGNVTSSPWPPTDDTETHLVFGINSGNSNPPQRPFNRADYFIRLPSTNMPQRCAVKTGVLYKAAMNQDADGNLNYLPLLDCAADFQVVYGLDMDEDGTTGTDANADGSALTSTEGASVATVQTTLASALLLRNRLKEVRAYVLAHEGQRDRGFTFTNLGPTVYPGACNTCIRVGPDSVAATVVGRDFDLSSIDDHENYRWRVFRLIVRPRNLGE